MKMKVLFASLLLAASGQALAQSSGQVGGQVFDENGDPVIVNGNAVIDNDFAEITRRLVEHVKTRNIYNF